MADPEGEYVASAYTLADHARILNRGGVQATVLFDDYKRSERAKSLRTEIEGLRKGKRAGSEEIIQSYQVEIDMLDQISLSWMGEGYDQIPVVPLSKASSLSLSSTDIFVIPEYAKPIAVELKKSKAPCLIVLYVQNLFAMITASSLSMSLINDLGIGHIFVNNEYGKDFMESNYKEGRLLKYTEFEPIVPKYFKKGYQTPQIGIYAKNPDHVSLFHKSFMERYPSMAWVSVEILRGMKREDFAKRLSKCAVGIQLDNMACYGTFIPECLASGVAPLYLESQFDLPYDGKVYSSKSIVNAKSRDGRYYDLVEAAYISLVNFLQGKESAKADWNFNLESPVSESEVLAKYQALIQDRASKIKKD